MMQVTVYGPRYKLPDPQYWSSSEYVGYPSNVLDSQSVHIGSPSGFVYSGNGGSWVDDQYDQSESSHVSVYRCQK